MRRFIAALPLPGIHSRLPCRAGTLFPVANYEKRVQTSRVFLRCLYPLSIVTKVFLVTRRLKALLSSLSSIRFIILNYL